MAPHTPRRSERPGVAVALLLYSESRPGYLRRDQRFDVRVAETSSLQEYPGLAAEGRGGGAGLEAVAVELHRRRQHSHRTQAGVRKIVEKAVGACLLVVEHLDGEPHGGRRQAALVEQALPLGGRARGDLRLDAPAE